MSERGIIMQAESVRAILAGRKTQTRRVYRPRNPEPWELPPGEGYKDDGTPWPMYQDTYGDFHPVLCPYGAPGDRLWVKEAFQFVCAHEDDDTLCVAYRASQVRDDGCLMVNNIPRPAGVVAPPPSRCWRSPMFMPRWASRLTLEVVEVRVQRVQEISEDDARADGLWRPSDDNPYGTHYVGEMIDRFAAAWDRINPKDPWASNPWVWAVSFKRVENSRE